MKLLLSVLAITTLMLVVLWQPRRTSDSFAQAERTSIKISNPRPPSLLPSTSRRLAQAKSTENDQSDELLEVNLDAFLPRLSGVDPFNKGSYRIQHFWRELLGIKNEEDATTLSLAIAGIVDAIKLFDVEHAIEIEPESKPEDAIWVQIPAIDPTYIDQARKSLAATLASICDNEELSMLYAAALEPMWKQVSRERILIISNTTTGYLINDNAPHEAYFIRVSHLQ